MIFLGQGRRKGLAKVGTYKIVVSGAHVLLGGVIEPTVQYFVQYSTTVREQGAFTLQVQYSTVRGIATRTRDWETAGASSRNNSLSISCQSRQTLH